MKAKTETTTASLAVVGVDIGKEVFHLVGLGTDGTIFFRRKIRQLSLKDVFAAAIVRILSAGRCGLLVTSRGLSRRSTPNPS